MRVVIITGIFALIALNCAPEKKNNRTKPEDDNTEQNQEDSEKEKSNDESPEKKAQETQGAAETTAIHGEWKGACKDLKDGSADFSAESDVSFKVDGTFEAIYKESYEKGCNDLKLKTRVTGNYSVGDSVDSPSGASGLTYTIKRIYLTPENGGFRFTLKRSKFCGLTNWTTGKEQEVTGQNCKRSVDGNVVEVNFPKTDAKVQDIYSIESDKLKLGIKFNEAGTGVNNERPSSYNGIEYSKK